MTIPLPPLDPGYHVGPLRADGPTADDVLALWRREAAVPDDVALRRVHEVQMVATSTSSGELVGVSTTPLLRVDQLGMDLWYFRAFVVEAHRQSDLAMQMLERCRIEREAAFVSGDDLRGSGMFVSVQAEGIRRSQNQGVWRRTGFVFIGENEKGHHYRVRYFPGALAPPPPP